MGAIVRSMLLLAWVLASCAPAAAAAGKEIVLATVLPLSGPHAALGTPLWEGADACITLVNSKGGVNGATLRLEKEDDRFDPKLTVAKTQQLMASWAPVALLNTAGSLQNQALVESGLLRKASIPLLGPRDGSAAVRSLKSPNLYFLIASVAAEADTMVHVAATIGRKQLAMVYSDDGDGRDALKEVERSARANGSTLAARYPVPPGSTAVGEIAKKIAADPGLHQVLVYGVTPMVAALYKQVRALRPALPVTAFSITSHAAIVDALGADAARGLMLAQVTLPTSSALPVMKEFRDAMDLQQIPEVRINNLHLEGFLAARVAVEALKRTRGTPTPEALAAALDQIHKADIGGLNYDFSNGRREGSAFVQIGVIGPQGKLMN